MTPYSLQTGACDGNVKARITSFGGLAEEQPAAFAQILLGLVLNAMPSDASDVSAVAVELEGFTLRPVEADAQPILIGACLQSLV